MTGLRRAKNGDWLSRKAIPEDIRDAYRLGHGVSREERFRRPGSLPQARAVAELRDWDAMVSGRIDALRAQREGRGRDLTQREAHALAGQWYLWFVARHEEEPGPASQWEETDEDLDSAYSIFAKPEDDEDAEVPTSPAVRRHVRATVATLADAQRFLAERQEVLSDAADALFLDTLEGELRAALRLLARRAEGDYSRDSRPDRFPAPTSSATSSVAPQAAAKAASAGGAKLAGMDSAGLFAAWVKERQPAPSTVNRWHSVFADLDAVHHRADAGALTEDQARAWADKLVTPKRSARVVNEVWLRAASVVWNWAVGKKLVTLNPFLGISIAVGRAKPKLREREFTDAEWRVILRASLVNGSLPTKPGPARSPHKAACRRWAPWLCAYTGARPGEVTQLRGEDVQQHPAGFWFLRLTPEAGTVKTGEARSVPLHPHLVEQGFLEFAKAAGSAPLFYDPASAKVSDDPTKPSRPPAVLARQKLSDWVRGLGVDDPGISPSHAWRHTWKRRAARAGMEKRLRDGWCGHAPATEGDRYEMPTLEDLAASLPLVTRYDLGGDA